MKKNQLFTLIFSLIVFNVCAQISPNHLTGKPISVTSPTKPLIHYWSTCVSAGALVNSIDKAIKLNRSLGMW